MRRSKTRRAGAADRPASLYTVYKIHVTVKKNAPRSHTGDFFLPRPIPSHILKDKGALDMPRPHENNHIFLCLKKRLA
ncbi:MAG: hypothetical protein A3J24_03130 [Deltaproteobacteria bacterium RIFCSPLOWO2_02_FULL_53_8]|nr:MAG: hypothetical protein A3J24_03130 [Deltaproteobacteria bacterium RIFCSPLOWO2_02_FULL_53_8]